MDMRRLLLIFTTATFFGFCHLRPIPFRSSTFAEEGVYYNCSGDRNCTVVHEYRAPCYVWECSVCDWGEPTCPRFPEPPREDCRVQFCFTPPSPIPPPPPPPTPPGPSPSSHVVVTIVTCVASIFAMAGLAWVGKVCIRRYRRSHELLLLDNTDESPGEGTDAESSDGPSSSGPAATSSREANSPMADVSSITVSSPPLRSGFQPTPLIPVSPPPLDKDNGHETDETDDEFDTGTHQAAARSLCEPPLQSTGAIPKSGTQKSQKNLQANTNNPPKATLSSSVPKAPKTRDYTSTAIFHYERVFDPEKLSISRPTPDTILPDYKEVTPPGIRKLKEHLARLNAQKKKD